MSTTAHGQTSELDVRERGAEKDGKPQVMDRRLFMQLLVLDSTPESSPTQAREALAASLSKRDASCVIYEDVNNPWGVGLLSWSENPEVFVGAVRPAVLDNARALRPRPEFTMFGRTYSSGFEPDLEFWLLNRPRETVLNQAWPWAIWYPLRRKGPFERLDGREKGMIMREHAEIGKSYGAHDLAHDVRLACHGLDTHDNDFVIGLVGRELYPLSHVVQAMRKTRQTAEYISEMGPFFVGRAVHRHGGK